MADLNRDKMLEELHSWGMGFINKSKEWRKASFESNWRVWQRNADSNYDPAIAAKKASWQSRAVWPITASHRENAQAALFRTEVGPRPPLEYKSRIEQEQPAIPGMPPPINQGALIRDVVLWEREKANYEIERNKQLGDKTTFGSGFMRIRFETKTDDREVQEPVYEQPSVFDPMSLMRAAQGQPLLLGYKKVVKPVVVYRGLVCEHISIWDVFPDPKALRVKGNAIAVRYETTYGEIVEGAQLKYYLPEAVLKLKDFKSNEQTPEDKQEIDADRGIAESLVERTDYGKKLECYEMEARLPKKWVYIDGQDIDDPEKLVPSVVRLHEHCVVSVRPSETYDGEPSIFKDDYFVVEGQFYGRGIPEMLKDVQLVSSETVNQRLDAISLTLRRKMGVVEQAIFDPKDLEEDRLAIRIKMRGPGFELTDVRQALMPLDMGGVNREAFVEPQEWERIAQERTSITRATLGSANAVNDTNKTLGGQQIQQGVTGDKLAYIGMISEFGFQRDFNHAVWALIYQNYQPEDYAMALGPQKASQLIIMSPEQIALNFRLVPKGIFEMENKALRQARIGSLADRYGMLPWFNILGAAKAEIASVDEDEGTFILPEAEAAQIMAKAQQIGQGMAEQALAQRDMDEKAELAKKGEKMQKAGKK